MFHKFPLKTIKIICKKLGIKSEFNFSFSFSSDYKQQLQSQLSLVLKNPTSAIFCKLLDCIQENEEAGYAILQDETCKKILIEKRPQELPHWILGVAVCQPNLAPIILKDEDYRNSLNADEFIYLVSNYPQLKIPVAPYVITSKENIDDKGVATGLSLSI